jgi:hypothetical protein
MSIIRTSISTLNAYAVLADHLRQSVSRGRPLTTSDISTSYFLQANRVAEQFPLKLPESGIAREMPGKPDPLSLQGRVKDTKV